MKDQTLYILWALLYLLCAALGFIPESTGFGTVVLVALCILFFVPGALLLFRGLQTGNRKQIRTIRNLSILSLSLTLIALVLNVFSAYGSEGMGWFLHVFLGLVSVPMLCGRFWALSMFLWACLLTASFMKKK